MAGAGDKLDCVCGGSPFGGIVGVFAMTQIWFVVGLFMVGLFVLALLFYGGGR